MGKEKRKRGLEFWHGALFSSCSPRPGWKNGGVSGTAQPSLSPLHPRQSLKKSWKEDLESKEWVWGHRELIVQEISWKAWSKHLKKSTELPPTLSSCISQCIVFNHYSVTVTCSNLLPQLHLAFAWQSLIKIELQGLQNKHLIKAECL